MKAPSTHGLFPGLLALLWLAATVPSALMAGETIFDGVDHECEIYLNGLKIGGHAGMYRQVGYDVGPAQRPGQINRLAVRIARMYRFDLGLK